MTHWSFSGDDGEVWGKKTTQGEKFLHRVCRVDALCMASLLRWAVINEVRVKRRQSSPQADQEIVLGDHKVLEM